MMNLWTAVKRSYGENISYFIDVLVYLILLKKRLEEDKRRLHQENAENRQVIQLLEMQKSILTKTVSDLHYVILRILMLFDQSEDHVNRAQEMDKYQRQVEEMMQERKTLQ
jgi:hypothetical protein